MLAIKRRESMIGSLRTAFYCTIRKNHRRHIYVVLRTPGMYSTHTQVEKVSIYPYLHAQACNKQPTQLRVRGLRRGMRVHAAARATSAPPSGARLA